MVMGICKALHWLPDGMGEGISKPWWMNTRPDLDGLMIKSVGTHIGQLCTSFLPVRLPLYWFREYGPSIGREEDYPILETAGIYTQGFARKNGTRAPMYWKAADLMTGASMLLAMFG